MTSSDTATADTSAAVTTPDLIRPGGPLCVGGTIIGVIGGIVTAFIPPAVSPDLYTYPHAPQGFSSPTQSSSSTTCCCSSDYSAWAAPAPPGTCRAGRAGVWISAGGRATLPICEFGAMTQTTPVYPSPSTDLLDTCLGVASILIGVGLVLADAGVVKTSTWTGWRRFVVLVCGVAVLVIVIPCVFGPFLAGRLALTVWMLMFAALGVALLHAHPTRLAPPQGGPR